MSHGTLMNSVVYSNNLAGLYSNINARRTAYCLLLVRLLVTRIQFLETKTLIDNLLTLIEYRNDAR